MNNFIAMVSIVAALQWATSKIAYLADIPGGDLSLKQSICSLYIGTGSDYDGRYRLEFHWRQRKVAMDWSWDRDYVAPSGRGAWGGFEYGS